MNLYEWRNLADIIRIAWFRGSAWCALNLSPTNVGLTAVLWTVAGALLLRRFSAPAIPPGSVAGQVDRLLQS